MVQDGLQGAIVPDLPHEEGADYLVAMSQNNLAPIFIYSPTTSDMRMKAIASFAKGFIYCVARKGVTGIDTDFSDQLEEYLGRCRAASDLPLALGFGVKDRADVDFIKGKADIAVIGTQTIRLMENEGIARSASLSKGSDSLMTDDCRLPADSINRCFSRHGIFGMRIFTVRQDAPLDKVFAHVIEAQLIQRLFGRNAFIDSTP